MPSTQDDGLSTLKRRSNATGRPTSPKGNALLLGTCPTRSNYLTLSYHILPYPTILLHTLPVRLSLLWAARPPPSRPAMPVSISPV